VTVVVVAAGVWAAGCNHTSDPATPTPYPVTTGRTAPTTLGRRSTACPDAFPEQLAVQTDAGAETPYLDKIVACTRAAQDATVLINRSNAAWTIQAPGANVAQLTDEVEVRSFLDMASHIYKVPVLAPQSRVRVDAAPADVQWNLAPGLGVMGFLQQQLVTKVKAYGKAQLTEMLTEGASLRRKALVTCGLAAYSFAGDAAQGLGPTDPTDRLLKGLGIASSATTCAFQWREADADALKRFPRTATWEDDVARMSRDTTFLRNADEFLSSLRRGGKYLAFFKRI